MNLNIFLSVTVLNFLRGNALISENLQVATPLGIIQGIENDGYISFEGIPYAEPPIDGLRFEPPVPFNKSFGIYNASKPGSPCLQWNQLIFDSQDDVSGEEDCLYLNIYLPKDVRFKEKLPVVFHIHGGSFLYQQGDIYGPRYITQRPIILVNFNYRIGPLGFLSSKCPFIPGNMGLKDQSTALRWVKNNIELFGGDSNKITITGFSAGGAFVHLHYLSEWSAGLFQNGISHSGTALDSWVMQRDHYDIFRRVVYSLGCQKDLHEDMFPCLKSLPAADIVRTAKEFPQYAYNPFSVFGVVTEPLKQKGIPFITEFPIDIIEAGRVQNIPWLVGITKDDGLYPTAQLLEKPEYLSFFNQNWNLVALDLLNFRRTISETKIDELSESIRQHYLDDKPIIEENFVKFVDITTDRMFHYGFDKSIRTQGKFNPIYAYQYNFKLSHSLAEVYAGQTSDQIGVGHGDDVLLIYSVNPIEHSLTDDEKVMQSNLLDMYENFISTSEPIFGDIAFVRSEDKDILVYTVIESPYAVSINADQNFAERAFWDNITFKLPCC